MIRVIGGKYRLHQFDAWVEVAILVGAWGWIATELHRSWFGHVLGFTEPFKDEPAANYAFEEACAYFQRVTAQSQSKKPDGPS